MIENIYAGNGLRFNPHERSNVITSTVVMPLALALRAVTADPFVSFGIFAVFFNAAALWTLWLLARRRPAVWALGVALLLASKSYMDFAWSGLENPMGYFLSFGAVYLWSKLHPDLAAGPEPEPQRRHWLALIALASLAPLYRHDFVLIVWPLAAWALWRGRRREGWPRTLLAAVAIGAPIGLWTLFSLAYFGLAFPLSSYNKLGNYGLADSLGIGWQYLRFSLHYDPLTIVVLVGATAGLACSRGPARALAIGPGLYMAYCLLFGADYMGGRFFAVPYAFVVAALLAAGPRLAALARKRLSVFGKQGAFNAAALALAAWILLWPHSPVLAPWVYQTDIFLPGDQYGVANERASWQPHTRLGLWLEAKRTGGFYPPHASARLGKLIAEQAGPEPVHVCNLGMLPYSARLDLRFVDTYALGDVFLSFMPSLTIRPGHGNRWKPKGLQETIAAGEPRFADPDIGEFHSVIRLLAASEKLFTGERLAAIVKFNLGGYRDLLPAPDATKEDLQKIGEIVAEPPAWDKNGTLGQSLKYFKPERYQQWASLYPPICYLKEVPNFQQYLERLIP